MIIGCQRITTAKNHFIDIFVATYIVKRLLPLFFTLAVLLVGEMTAKTVATVNGAGGTDDEQQAVAVFMYNAATGLWLDSFNGSSL